MVLARGFRTGQGGIMKTIKITAEEMLINNTGLYILACDGQEYEVKKCLCKKCHNTKGGE